MTTLDLSKPLIRRDGETVMDAVRMADDYIAVCSEVNGSCVRYVVNPEGNYQSSGNSSLDLLNSAEPEPVVKWVLWSRYPDCPWLVSGATDDEIKAERWAEQENHHSTRVELPT